RRLRPFLPTAIRRAERELHHRPRAGSRRREGPPAPRVCQAFWVRRLPPPRSPRWTSGSAAENHDGPAALGPAWPSRYESPRYASATFRLLRTFSGEPTAIVSP